MDNATPIEAISLNFTSNNKDALSSFDEVINKLKQLQNRLPTLKINITGTKNLEAVGQAANNLPEEGINKISRLADALTKLSAVSIPNGIASSLRSINKAMNTTGVEGAEKAAEAISKMHDITSSVQGSWGQNTIVQSMEALTEIAPPIRELGEYFSVSTLAAYQLSSGIEELTGKLLNLKGVMGFTPSGGFAQAFLPSGQTVQGALPQTSSYYEMHRPKFLENANIQEATQRFAELGNVVGTGRQEFDKFAVAAFKINLGDIFSGATSKAREFFSTMRTGFANFMTKPRSLDNLVSGMTPFGSALGTGLKAIGKGMFMPLVKELQYVGKSALGAAGRLGSFFGSIKRIATYRLIRMALKLISNGFKEGVGNLYEWSKAFDKTHEFAKSMDKIATAALYVKNSLGAMVAPIINALAPALDWLADKFVSLLNIVNEFFAALTGASTYTVAKKVATEFKEAADNTGKATKALKSYTIGIDELNIIEESKGSGSGGNKGSNVAQDWFEKHDVSTGMKDFVDSLKKYFQSGDWKGLGTFLGTEFNKLVDKVPWESIGTKAGKLFTAGFTTLNAFLNTADFVKMGSKIGSMVNKFFEHADFSQAGEALVGALFGGVDLIGGFLGTVKWGTVTGKISDFFIGGMRKAKKWFESKNWKEIGSKIYQSVKDGLNGLKLTDLISSGWELIRGVTTATIDVVVGFVTEAGEDIGNWFYELSNGKLPSPENPLIFTIANVGGDIIEGLVYLAKNGYIDGDLNITVKSIGTGLYNIGKAFVTGAAGEENIGKIENSVTGTWWEKLFYATKMSDWYDMFEGYVDKMLDKIYGIGDASDNARRRYLNLVNAMKKKNEALQLQYAREEVKKLIKELDTANPKMKTLKENIFAYMSGETLSPGNLAGTIFGKNYTTASEVAGGMIASNIEKGMKGELTTNAEKNTINPIYNTIKNKENQEKIKAAAKSLGGEVKTGFNKVDFTKLGKNVVTGVKKGIDDNRKLVVEPAKSLAKLTSKTFEKMTEQHSPSKLFARYGKNLVLGLNMGIEDNMYSSQKAVQTWAGSLSDTDFSIDNISMPSVSDIVDEVQGYIATTGTMSFKNDTENMQRFYEETVIPLMSSIANDTKRQADKDEKTDVYMDSRRVAESVNRQNRANGYSFIR